MHAFYFRLGEAVMARGSSKCQGSSSVTVGESPQVGSWGRKLLSKKILRHRSVSLQANLGADPSLFPCPPPASTPCNTWHRGLCLVLSREWGKGSLY